ncbi:hypothetical protein M231_08052 [Tremella mesenterica]|uniref:Uncharacterized protein n=1 Tax=Tremella mesenterica TaxID=5217 RepID=A0A4Q1BF61_TREME|nr:hypothetical protein M231_08052 [Tremella mesenterica]
MVYTDGRHMMEKDKLDIPSVRGECLYKPPCRILFLKDQYIFLPHLKDLDLTLQLDFDLDIPSLTIDTPLLIISTCQILPSHSAVRPASQVYKLHLVRRSSSL